MKSIQVLTSALIALGLVAQASADPTVYLTGSSAFRSTVEAALANNNGTSEGGVFDKGSITYQTWGSSSAGSATYMVFHGTIGGSPVYVDCAFSGSEAGIASACNTTLQNQDRSGNPIPLNGSPETWMNVSNSTVEAALSSSPSPVSSNPTGAELETSSHGADLTQADTSQAISWTPYVANTTTALKDYGSEGAVTFTWIRNLQLTPTHEWLDCTNVTLPEINTLLGDGSELASFFTGNPNDDDMFVYLVGRNLGSGTRMNCLATSQYGAHNTIHQYSIGYGVESTDPAQTTSTLILTNEADNGYESGGGVVKALTDTGGGTIGSCQQTDPNTGLAGWFAVGYVSPSDALNSGNNGGVGTNAWLTLDGVSENNGNIENGSYWFWGHEHLYGRNGISGIADTVGNALFDGVIGTMESAQFNYGSTAGGHDPGIPWALMQVHKPSDVSFPIPGNTPDGE